MPKNFVYFIYMHIQKHTWNNIVKISSAVNNSCALSQKLGLVIKHIK